MIFMSFESQYAIFY